MRRPAVAADSQEQEPPKIAKLIVERLPCAAAVIDAALIASAAAVAVACSENCLTTRPRKIFYVHLHRERLRRESRLNPIRVSLIAVAEAVHVDRRSAIQRSE